MLQRSNKYLKITILVLSLFLPFKAFSLACPNGEIYEVGGTVITINTSETTQLGNPFGIPGTGIQIDLYDSDGVLYYGSPTGIIAGETVSQTGAVILLNHEIDLLDGNTISTLGDMAILRFPPLAFDGNGDPCAFGVTEVISDFEAEGDDIGGATGFITATGTISFCPGANMNTFELGGRLCLP